MALALSTRLREKPQIDWKKLHLGEKLPKENSYRKNRREVLDESFDVERIIHSRTKPNEGRQYLIKWVGYPLEESTWEPETHIPKNIRDSFHQPHVTEDRLTSHGSKFERSIQTLLRSNCNRLTIEFDFDVYRYLFCTTNAVIVNEEDLETLSHFMTDHWHYYLRNNGHRMRINFPIRLAPRLINRKSFIKKDGQLKEIILPIERLTIITATRVCSIKTLPN